VKTVCSPDIGPVAKRPRGRPRKQPLAVALTPVEDGQARHILEPLTVRIPIAVQLTGLSRSKIYELIGDGEIAVVKIGASTLVTMASLRDLISRHQHDNARNPGQSGR
jgi:hypothetical protein